MRKLVTQAPRSAAYQQSLGNTLMKLCRYSEAEEPLTAATDLDPRNPMAPCLLGLCLQEMSRIDDAKAAYRTAMARDPKIFPAILKSIAAARAGWFPLNVKALKRELTMEAEARCTGEPKI